MYIKAHLDVAKTKIFKQIFSDQGLNLLFMYTFVRFSKYKIVRCELKFPLNYIDRAPRTTGELHVFGAFQIQKTKSSTANDDWLVVNAPSYTEIA